MFLVWFPLGLVGTALAWDYLLAPLLLLLDRGRDATAPRLAVVRIASLLPMDLEQALKHQEGPLRRLGFEPLQPIRDARDAGQVRTGRSGVTHLYRHPTHGDAAVVVSIPRKDGAPLTALSFETPLADGTVLVTSNAPLPLARPPHPSWRWARFAAERDAARLHALHRARLAGVPAAAPPTIDDAPGWLRAREQQSIDWLVASGYGRRRGDRVRYTVRGAYGAVLRAKAPWRWMEGRAHEKERKRLLGVSGIGP